jgi:hypothetical protein
MGLVWSQQVAARGRAPGAAGDLVVRDTGLDGKPLGGLSYSDTLPLRMCPGGMMSLIYASLILATLGELLALASMWAVADSCCRRSLCRLAMVQAPCCCGVLCQRSETVTSCHFRLDAQGAGCST